MDTQISSIVVIESLPTAGVMCRGGQRMKIESYGSTRLSVTVGDFTFSIEALELKQLANAAFEMVQR